MSYIIVYIAYRIIYCMCNVTLPVCFVCWIRINFAQPKTLFVLPFRHFLTFDFFCEHVCWILAYCLLPIAYCLLPIAYCLLPIAYLHLPMPMHMPWAGAALVLGPLRLRECDERESICRRAQEGINSKASIGNRQ